MSTQSTVAQEQHFLSTVALKVMTPLAGERTLQAAYYILRGRKANQTLQDVYLYTLYPYYRMFPRLSKEEWDKIISTLLQEGFIRQLSEKGGNSKQSFEVTGAGMTFAEEHAAQYRLDTWLAPFTEAALSDNLEVFWKRLHLIVQTFSQMLADDLAFLPVVTEKSVQQWVKGLIGDATVRNLWKEGLRDELLCLWGPLPVDVQELLVVQLSGASQVGKTLGQLAQVRRVPATYLTLQYRYGLAVSMQRLTQESDCFPLLSKLTVHTEKIDTRLSESGARTYALLKRGYGKEEIARMRKIKESTVEDHLVEIALRCEEWDLSAYLSQQEAGKVVDASMQLGTSRLRLIKDYLGESVSYLQIRLALARRQGGKKVEQLTE